MIHLKKFILSLWIVRFFLTKILPKIRFSISAPKMTGAQFNAFVSILQPGDIVFSTDRSKLSSFLIPGEWDHAGIYVGDGWIVEAVLPKVRAVSVFDFCHTSDAVGVAGPRWKNVFDVIAKAWAFVGRPYDTLFDQGHEALYCSELVAALDPENAMGADTTDQVGIGFRYVSPDDLWNAKNVVRLFHGSTMKMSSFRDGYEVAP